LDDGHQLSTSHPTSISSSGVTRWPPRNLPSYESSPLKSGEVRRCLEKSIGGPAGAGGGGLGGGDQRGIVLSTLNLKPKT